TPSTHAPSLAHASFQETMRDSCFPRFFIFTLLGAAGCDSGESSLPETTTGGAGTMAAISSGAATTGASSGAATSTTGNTTSGGAQVFPTGRGCTPASLTESGQLQGPYGRTTITMGGLEYFLQVNEWNSTAPQTMS